MPIKVNYFNPFTQRFDFGVPLEDVFPPNDVHPRLKYLFEEAYKLHANSVHNIEQIVRQLQGSLETRLELKEKIIHDIHYDIKTDRIEEAPGAYFWIIRHFLGLLPIPLLPTYSQEIRFDWIGLSEECNNFLQHYESKSKKKSRLDYDIAESLNLLPFEHFLLLTILIYFIRKLSVKPGYKHQIDRKILLFLCKYYNASTSVRPYIPGHKDRKMFPLFFYIVLRWREIEKNCRKIGHPAYFLESNYLNYKPHTSFNIRDNWVQTSNFSPEIITIYKNVPYFCNNNNYLKDTSCQTEKICSIDKSVQNTEVVPEEHTKNGTVQISDQETSSIYPSLDTSLIDDYKYFMQNEKPCDNAEFSFTSTDDTSKLEWSEIVKETVGTVKKVEEYIYDDYDTFNKEEYNQISESSKSKGSMMNKLSRIGWTYTPNNSAREETKERSFDITNEAEETYIKFEDVFDEHDKYRFNEEWEDDDKNNHLDVTFKRYNDSKTPLCGGSCKSATGVGPSEEKTKKNFNLKRFKLKLDFLRVLTPKKAGHSTPSYDSIESKIKYKKIKNIKSNTL